jgi:hypothetical protein
MHLETIALSEVWTLLHLTTQKNISYRTENFSDSLLLALYAEKLINYTVQFSEQNCRYMEKLKCTSIVQGYCWAID